jgi:hypothetical protein
MKKHILTILTLAWLPAIGLAQTTVIGFDDITANTGTASITPVPAGYNEFNWDNFYVVSSDAYPGTGYANGVTSGNYAAFNGYGAPAAIVGDAPFSLVSGNFTAAYDASDSLEVDGYLDGNLVDTTTFDINDVSPTPQTLDFNNVDTVVFTNADSSESFVADDLTVSVPEPGSISLLGTGLPLLLRRRRGTPALA